jgi:hypothetical protein
MNESALKLKVKVASFSIATDVCLSVCMHATKCIVTKLQKLQTSALAEIHLLITEIDVPSDVNIFRHFDRHLEFLKTNI